MTCPKLDLVIPYCPSDQKQCEQLIASLETQRYPQEQLVVHLIAQGNSEEAKAYGIQQCHGDIIGLLCTDNRLTRNDFLEQMVKLASREDVIGAYPAYYAYVPTDPMLNRYFALLGANDPVCQYLGKADRYPYSESYPIFGVREFTKRIPSIGDNGLFIKRQALQMVVNDPHKHFCIDAIEDLRQLGLSTYYVADMDIHHQTGSSWRTYFRKRYRYVKELYWRDYGKRRWRMVETKEDWNGVLRFALGSLLIIPPLRVAWRGYQQKPDKAWFLHPVICLGITLTYTWAWLLHRLPRLLFHRGNVHVS